MQSAADFISNFIRNDLKNLNEEEELRSALTGVVGLNTANLHEAVVRKLIAALRKKKCKVDTPRNKDPLEVLVKWIAASPTTVAQRSGTVNNSLQEQGQNRSDPKGSNRKSGRKRRSRSLSSEDEPAPANNGGGPSNSVNATNTGEAPNSCNSSNMGGDSTNNSGVNNGGTPTDNVGLNPPSTLGPDSGTGANAGGGILAPAPPTAVAPINAGAESSMPSTSNAARSVVFDQQSYVNFLGLMDRFKDQLEDLSAEQKRTREMLAKQQAADAPRSPSHSKRSRKASSPSLDTPSAAARSPEAQFSPGTREDLSELDKFISDPFDEGGMDEESRDLQKALNDFSKQVTREDDEVQIVSEQGDSNDDSDEFTSNRSKRDRDKTQAPHLKFSGLRPKSERNRAITHQNGFPEAIKWLRSKGISLARFVAGHEIQMKPRDKQELEVLSATLLSLVDQIQPGMVVQLDAADILIRRIMSLCLRDKLDDDYLDVLSNPSGSHLAPLEWLTEANKVYKILKKAKDSRSTSGKAHIPTPRWRSQQHLSKSTGSKGHGKSSQNSGTRPNRVPAPQRSSHQPRGGQREKHDGGRGAGTDGSSSSNNN